MDIYLKKLSLDDREQIIDYIKEFKKEKLDSIAGHIPYHFVMTEDFDGYYKRVVEIENNPPEGKVKATQFLALRKIDNYLVGLVNVRHELNENLIKSGGHIGYSVRPSERNKGYAKSALKLALEFGFNELKLDSILLTVLETNTPSIKVIKKFNPVEDQVYIDEKGNVFRRFWINKKIKENKK